MSLTEALTGPGADQIRRELKDRREDLEQMSAMDKFMAQFQIVVRAYPEVFAA